MEAGPLSLHFKGQHFSMASINLENITTKEKKNKAFEF
jgi:hypothetical protein